MVQIFSLTGDPSPAAFRSAMDTNSGTNDFSYQGPRLAPLLSTTDYCSEALASACRPSLASGVTKPSSATRDISEPDTISFLRTVHKYILIGLAIIDLPIAVMLPSSRSFFVAVTVQCVIMFIELRQQRCSNVEMELLHVFMSVPFVFLTICWLKAG